MNKRQKVALLSIILLTSGIVIVATILRMTLTAATANTKDFSCKQLLLFVYGTAPTNYASY